MKDLSVSHIIAITAMETSTIRGFERMCFAWGCRSVMKLESKDQRINNRIEMVVLFDRLIDMADHPLTLVSVFQE